MLEEFLEQYRPNFDSSTYEKQKYIIHDIELSSVYKNSKSLNDFEYLGESKNNLDQIIFFSLIGYKKEYEQINKIVKKVRTEGDRVISKNIKEKITFYYSLECLSKLLEHKNVTLPKVNQVEEEIEFFLKKLKSLNLFDEVDKTELLLNRIITQLQNTSGKQTKEKLALVMKGGGIKGLAYIGALEELNKHFRFDWFVGISAGALYGIILGVLGGILISITIIFYKNWNYSEKLRLIEIRNS
jgi:hypothetical protein